MTENFVSTSPIELTTFSHSVSIVKIVEALIKAESEFTTIVKSAENPYYHSKYADLNAIIEATKPALKANNILLIQSPSLADRQLTVTTMLIHASGEWFKTELTLPANAKGKDGADRFDAQTVGLTITYARRYAQQAILNLAAEDDDGNEASGVGKSEKSKATEKTKVESKPKVESDIPAKEEKLAFAERIKAYDVDPELVKKFINNETGEPLNKVTRAKWAMIFELLDKAKADGTITELVKTQEVKSE